MGFDLSTYEEVKDRIPRFWEKNPDGAIVTDLIEHGERDYIVRASLINGAGQIIATGLAQETVGSSPVNKLSALENCETSAIGRALANAGYSAGKNRPSREEMDKAVRADAAHAPDGAGSDRGSRPAPGRPATSTAATKPQIAKINHLVSQTGAVPETWPLPVDLSKADASKIIDWLMTFPVEPPAERVASLRDAADSAQQEFVG